jgi:hypothetical protein
MLWPLMMWGCEEEDPDDGRWIIEVIRKWGMWRRMRGSRLIFCRRFRSGR